MSETANPVQEAWAVFMREPEVADYLGGFAESTIAAARALALAALDLGFTYDERHNHATVRPGCCAYHAARAEIEKLGMVQ